MKSCDKYSTGFISRFVDNEVPPRDHDAFVHHMTRCGECAEKEAEFRKIARTFESHANSGVTHIRKHMPPLSVEKKPGRVSRLITGFSRPMGMGPRLASVSAAALILVMAVYPWSGKPIPGPSAIVNSVDTYGSSVMIIESSNTQHTIIWFSENGTDNQKPGLKV